MLILTRKTGERIRIGDDIELVVTRISGNRVTVGLSAPAGVRIVRSELKPLPAPQSGIPSDVWKRPVPERVA